MTGKYILRCSTRRGPRRRVAASGSPSGRLESPTRSRQSRPAQRRDQPALDDRGGPAVDRHQPRSWRVAVRTSTQQAARWLGADQLERRVGVGASSTRVRAAGLERAAGRRVDRGPAARPGSGSGGRRGSGRGAGWSASGPRVYGWRGSANVSSTGAVSTMWPAYMTLTRSTMPATTPRSWVIRMSAMPELALAGAGGAPGSGPGSSRRGPWSARRR